MLSSAEPVNILIRLKEALWSASAEVFGDGAVLILSGLGIGILLLWLSRYDGLNLERVPVRRNRMNAAIPLVFLLAWLLLMVALAGFMDFLFDKADSPAAERTSYSLNAGIEILLILAMLVVAHFQFARGLRGLGLRFSDFGRDSRWSLVYLLAIYPLIFIGLWCILFGGRLLQGPDFTIQQHETIEVLTTTDSTLTRLFVAVFAIVIVPFFEELLFRGFLQTAISTRTRNVWLAIGLTSLFFAILHPWQHRVGLFFLSCGLGYAYERSGSLFRPVLMHAFFNCLSVLVNVSQAAM